MTRPICYVCENNALPASGYSQSKVLIIGSEPHFEDVKQGKVFSMPTKQWSWSDGKILRKEFALAGADLYQFRMTSLWYHKAPDKKNKNYEACFEASRNACLSEAKGKEAVLLVGADACEYFTGYKLSDVAGLALESNMLSAPIIYAMQNPVKSVIGEIRFSIVNFVNHIKREGLV